MIRRVADSTASPRNAASFEKTNNAFFGEDNEACLCPGDIYGSTLGLCALVRGVEGKEGGREGKDRFVRRRRSYGLRKRGCGQNAG